MGEDKWLSKVLEAATPGLIASDEIRARALLSAVVDQACAKAMDDLRRHGVAVARVEADGTVSHLDPNGMLKPKPEGVEDGGEQGTADDGRDTPEGP